jgi:hypothetical protein
MGAAVRLPAWPLAASGLLSVVEALALEAA